MRIRGNHVRALALGTIAASTFAFGGVAVASQDVLAEHPDAPAVAEMRGITIDAAGARLELEQAAGALEADVRRLHADTFAGLWIDDAGRVNVAFTDDAAETVAALARDFSQARALRAVTLPRSLDSLEALQQRLVSDRESARLGLLGLPGIAGAAYDLEIDVQRNVVVLAAPAPTAATVAEVAARYGPAVEVRAAKLAAADACSRTDCRYTLRSGLQVNSPASYCSSAFTVKRDDNGTRNLLSAAHCSDSTRSHGGVTYGTVQAQQQSGRVDGERHSVGSNGFGANAWIFVDSDRPTREVRGRNLYANLAVGSTACKSGARTGYTCGKVLGKSYAPSYVTNSNDFIKADYCGKGGDSGAGVFVDNTALGINSGSTLGDTCTADDFTIFGHIEYAQNALNATVMISAPVASFTGVNAAHASTMIRTRFSEGVLCGTVQPADFTAKVNGVPTTVTAAACSADSDRTVDLTVSTPMVTGMTISVSLVGTITDPAGNAVAKVTRSDTVTTTIAE